MNTSYSWADGMIGAISQKRKKAQESAFNAEMLPYELTTAFKEKGDPKLDKQINEAEQRSLSAGYEGLDKYQTIENPFTRRALAEKYQSSVAGEYKNLLSEQDRRQGVITDYIKTWSGTYGAIAKAEQMAVDTMKDEYTMKMDLEDRRVKASGGSDTKTSEKKQYITDMLNGSAGKDGRFDPGTYSQLRDWAFSELNLSKKQFDEQFGTGTNERDREALGFDSKTSGGTEKQQNEEKYYKFINDIESGKNRPTEKIDGKDWEYYLDEGNGNLYRRPTSKYRSWYWNDSDVLVQER